MSTTRQELEARLATFAAAYNPILTVSYKGVPFTRPAQAPGVMWLECYFVSGPTITVTTDATRNRERGNWVVNCWLASGNGVGKLDTLAAAIVSTFKVLPKTGNVSIEQPGTTGKVNITSDGWMCITVSFPYRVESTA